MVDDILMNQIEKGHVYMIKIVGVRFRSAGKVYYFDPKDLELRMGDHVIAETSKGPEYGVISTCMKMVDEELVQQPLRALVRKATPEDEQRIDSLRIKEKEALRVCREKVHEHELEMKMVDAEYSFDGSKVLFYFTADGRVDFRSLVKDLASVFHVRIELRQIGVRDETRMLGGIGICGRELCCATYLRDFQPVSIKMAKEQNLSLNPTKISGACGRLMCCLKNEEATYEFLNARMPKMGEEAITADGQSGKVVELDVLRQRVRVLFEEGDTKEIEVFPVEELTFRPKKKKDPSQQGKKAKNEKTGKAEKSGKGEKGEKTEKADTAEKNETIEKTESAGDIAQEFITEEWNTKAAADAELFADVQEPAELEKVRRKDRSGKTDAGEKRDRSGKTDAGEKKDRSGKEDGDERAEHTEGKERKRPRRRKHNRPEGGQAAPGQDTPKKKHSEKGSFSSGKTAAKGGASSGNEGEKSAVKKRRRFRPRPKGPSQERAER